MAYEQEMRQANQLRARGNRDAAAELYKKILKKDFNNPDGLHGLALVAADNHNLDAARDIFLRALKSDPDRADIWTNFSFVLNDMKDTGGAERALQNALNLDPDHAPAYQQLGLIALIKGETEKAISLMEKALAINAELDSCYLHLARTKPVLPGDPMVKAMTRLTQDPTRPGQSLSNLHFALAAVFERAGDTEKYLSHLEKANHHAHQPGNNWRFVLEHQYEMTRRFTTREFLEVRVSDALKKFTPIFIVGLPRSGTTLTDQIFGTHSQVFAGDELPYFIKYLRRATGARSRQIYPDGGELLTPKDLEEVSLAYQARVRTLCADKPFMTDKLPWNYQNIGMIYKVLPWAKVIHIHRDPVDCGFSIYRNPLTSDIQFACDFDGYAYYRSFYQKFMDLWKELIPDFVVEVAYEDLVAEPERELRRLLDFCGLPWEDGVLGFHQTKREVRTLSLGQVNRPLNRASIGYREKYGAFLKPLEEALKRRGVT